MADANQALLIFDDFLSHLRRQGFEIGVDHYLRLQELLRKAGSECTPQSLKTHLCPIFATNNSQQEQFYRAFHTYFTVFQPMRFDEVPLPSEAEIKPVRARKWVYALVAIAFVVLIGVAVIGSWPPPSPTPQPTNLGLGWAGDFITGLYHTLHGLAVLWLAILTPVLLFFLYQQTLPSNKTRSAILLLVLFTQPILWLAFPELQTLSSFSDSATWLPIFASLLLVVLYGPIPKAPSSDAKGYEASAPHLRIPVLCAAVVSSGILFLVGLRIHWAALFAPVLLFVIHEWHRYKTRGVLLQRQRGVKPPFVWPIRIKAFAPRLFDPAIFHQAARLMRQRQTGETYRLDIGASVAATTEAGGYPTLRYRLDTKPPEYLILIERDSYRDHQAQMFDELAQALEREGIFVARYFYDADPRVCCDEDGGCLSLLDVHSKFPAHRLLVFGDGEDMLDPITGELSTWTSVFSSWPDKALLTPVPPAQWSVREMSLASLFIVLPASLTGLLTLVTHFESLTETDVQGGRASTSETTPALDGDPAEVIAALRKFLGEPTFQWLCVCAVYPELHWDLTLFFGSLSVMGGNLIREENLLRFIRLPWFRSGSFPDEVRWRLLGELDPVKEVAVRPALIELLERDPPPQETYAADSYQLNLVVQRWLSRRDRRHRRDLLAALPAAAQSQLTGDYTLLRWLEATPPSPLNLYMPRRLHRAFYRNGIPAFGLRTVVRLLLAVMAAAAGLALREYGGWAVIRISNPSDTLFFIAYPTIILLISSAAIIFTWKAVHQLRNTSAVYKARLPFAYYSLSSWIFWVLQYLVLISWILIPSQEDFFLSTALWVGVVHHALWTVAILSLYSEQVPRLSITLPWLTVFSILIAFVGYQTEILASAPFTQVEAELCAIIFTAFALSIRQLRLNKLFASAFFLHGLTQWLWRALLFSPSLGTRLAILIVFPIWHIGLLLSWVKIISVILQRPQSPEEDIHMGFGALQTPLVPFRVMISSTVEDLAPERDAADRAILGLHLTRFRAETFGSLPGTPRSACELMAKQCDLFILIIGERYGHVVEPEGVSVVEFEYEVARGDNPEKILVYVKDGVMREPRLEKFLQKVQDFELGYFKSLFTTPEELYQEIQVDVAHRLTSQAKQSRKKSRLKPWVKARRLR